MRLRKLFLLLVMLALGSASRQAHAQLSLLMTFGTDSLGINLGGLGLGTASISFGNIRAFGGTVPLGVSKSRVGNSYVLSTLFDVQVTGLGIINPTYTLAAKLVSADPNDTWQIGSLSVTNAGFTTLTTTAPYITLIPWTFTLTIPFSAPSGALANTVFLIATGN